MDANKRRALIEETTAEEILRIALLNGHKVGSAVRHDGEYIEPTKDGYARVYWYIYDDEADEMRTEYPAYMLDAAVNHMANPIQAAANYIAGVPVVEFGGYDDGNS